jgi:hypothetical protein
MAPVECKAAWKKQTDQILRMVATSQDAFLSNITCSNIIRLQGWNHVGTTGIALTLNAVNVQQNIRASSLDPRKGDLESRHRQAPDTMWSDAM